MSTEPTGIEAKQGGEEWRIMGCSIQSGRIYRALGDMQEKLHWHNVATCDSEADARRIVASLATVPKLAEALRSSMEMNTELTARLISFAGQDGERMGRAEKSLFVNALVQTHKSQRQDMKNILAEYDRAQEREA